MEFRSLSSVAHGRSPGVIIPPGLSSLEQPTAETPAREQQRNAAGARIKWMFTTKKASIKMGQAHPKTQANSG
jgi:hypothetical protein